MPEALASGGPNTLQSIDFCHHETPYLPQYKALASYTLPWYGIRVSGTLQSLPARREQMAQPTTSTTTPTG